MIAGIDYSSFQIDTVMLDEDSNRAEHYRRGLGRGNSLARTRRVRDAMPARGLWKDSGVTLVAIEEPFHHSHQALVPLLLVLGALVATFPPDVPVQLLRADDWRRELGMKLRCPREEHKAAAITFAAEHWENAPDRVDDNAADAFCVAWAARSLEDVAA